MRVEKVAKSVCDSAAFFFRCYSSHIGVTEPVYFVDGICRWYLVYMLTIVGGFQNGNDASQHTNWWNKLGIKLDLQLCLAI